jgi:hypothetical protein
MIDPCQTRIISSNLHITSITATITNQYRTIIAFSAPSSLDDHVEQVSAPYPSGALSDRAQCAVE